MQSAAIKIISVLFLILQGCGSEPTNSSSRRFGHASKGSAEINQDDCDSKPENCENQQSVKEPISFGLSAMKVEILKSDLSYLTQDKFKGRLSGTTGNEEVASYIKDQLKSLSIPSYKNSGYEQSFTLKNGPMAGKKTSNLIAYLEGNDPVLKQEVIVVGAHMDHAGSLSLGFTCSRGASGSNEICNGADDNASGTSSLLTVARSLAAVRTHLKRSILLIWFSGEEEGLEGSTYYVEKNPLLSLKNTVYMINMDMVGYANTFGYKIAALGSGTSESAEEKMMDISSQYSDYSLEPTARAGGGSDHVPFMAAGVPGVFFHTGVSNNPHYHRTSDTAEKIDYQGMLAVSKITFELVVTISTDDYFFEEQKRTFVFSENRPSFISDEEKLQSCHDLQHIH